MKNFSTMKPRDVEAYLREQVLKTFGDEVENKTIIQSSHGYYSVGIRIDTKRYLSFTNFRKTDAPKIVKSMRALK